MRIICGYGCLDDKYELAREDFTECQHPRKLLQLRRLMIIDRDDNGIQVDTNDDTGKDNGFCIFRGDRASGTNPLTLYRHIQGGILAKTVNISSVNQTKREQN
jgi:hypothetical protein